MDINKPDSDATFYLLDVSNDVWHLKFILGIFWTFLARKGYQMVFKYGTNHTITFWNILKEFCMVGVDFSPSHAVNTFWYMEQDFRVGPLNGAWKTIDTTDEVESFLQNI